MFACAVREPSVRRSAPCSMLRQARLGNGALRVGGAQPHAGVRAAVGSPFVRVNRAAPQEVEPSL